MLCEFQDYVRMVAVVILNGGKGLSTKVEVLNYSVFSLTQKNNKITAEGNTVQSFTTVNLFKGGTVVRALASL